MNYILPDRTNLPDPIMHSPALRAATSSMRHTLLEITVSGKLELIFGRMRSNKSAELLRRIEIRRNYAKQYVMLMKPSDDTKAAAGLVESRNQNGCGKMKAIEFRYSDP